MKRLLFCTLLVSTSALAAPHQYWRLNFTKGAATNITVIDLVQFFDSTSTQISTTGGTASSNSTQGGSSPANAFDGSVNSSWWISNTAPTNAAPVWLEYAFASAVDVVSMKLMPRQSFTSQWPTDVSLQYSDDNSSWTTLYSWTGLYYNNGVTGVSGVITSPGQGWSLSSSNAAPSSGGVYYRLNITSAVTNTSQAQLTEFVLKDGLSNPFSSSLIAGISDSVNSGEDDGAWAAFDGSANTYWASNAVCSSGTPCQIGYWYSSSSVYPATFTLTPRNNIAGAEPANFSLQQSADGITWRTLQTYTATWSSYSAQTFTVPAQPTAGQTGAFLVGP